MNKILNIALMVALATGTTVTLNGCTANYDSQNRRIATEGTTYKTTYGMIISAEPVKIKEEIVNEGTSNSLGAIGGAVVGGLIGYNSNHHHHYHGHSGSDAGGIIGGLIGLGAGLLLSNLINNSANRVDGLRLNVITFDNQNFTIDVPKDERLVPDSYVQINITGDGYTQLTPISKEAYNAVRRQQANMNALINGNKNDIANVGSPIDSNNTDFLSDSDFDIN